MIFRMDTEAILFTTNHFILSLRLTYVLIFSCVNIVQVTMEEHPSSSFVNVSAEKCWESVLERVNGEIIRRRELGEIKLPPPELLQSINGLKMFGFLSPSIIQVMHSHPN